MVEHYGNVLLHNIFSHSLDLTPFEHLLKNSASTEMEILDLTQELCEISKSIKQCSTQLVITAQTCVLQYYKIIDWRPPVVHQIFQRPLPTHISAHKLWQLCWKVAHCATCPFFTGAMATLLISVNSHISWAMLCKLTTICQVLTRAIGLLMSPPMALWGLRNRVTFQQQLQNRCTLTIITAGTFSACSSKCLPLT